MKNRPKVILKFAQSVDGFIGQAETQIWLTNKYSRILSHKWRSEIDAILVGTSTAAVDDPSLTNRLYLGKHPIRIVIDKRLRLSPDLQIFDDKAPTIIINEIQNSTSLKPLTNIFLKMQFDTNFWEVLFIRLHNMGINTLMIEGGAYTLQTVVNSGLWDEVRVLTASLELKQGIQAPEFKGRLINTFNLLEDIIKVYYPLKRS